MKQLYYTSCKQDEGLEGRGGLQVRATSPDVGGPMLRAAVRYCYYFLPFGDEYRPDIVEPADAPIRFAFLNTPELGAIALRAVYAGIDPASGRPGNPFVHLVFNDSAHHLNAYRVLSSWQSSFWKTDAGTTGTRLTDLFELPQNGLHDSILGECAEEEGWPEKVGFLANALLQFEEAQQIFVVGEPPQIVGMLLAVARIVPPVFRRKLTFSTYERDVDGQISKFVGTTWGTMPANHDLPEYCYHGRAAAINLKTNRCTSSIDDLAYTRFAVSAICEGTLEETVDPFLSFCEECGVKDLRDLDAVFRNYDPASGRPELRTQDLQTVFRYPPLATRAFRSRKFSEKLLSAIEEAPEQFANFRDPLCAYLKDDSKTSQTLAEQIYEMLLERMRGGSLDSLDSLRRNVLPLIDKPNPLLLNAFRHFAEQDQLPTAILPTDVWLYLIRIWEDLREARADESSYRRWLSVEDSRDLNRVLRAVPDVRLQADILRCNCEQGILPSGMLLEQVIRRPELVADLLQDLAVKNSRHVKHMVALVRDQGPREYLATLLRYVKKPHPSWVLPLLQTTSVAQGEEFLHNHGRWLLSAVGKTPELDTFLTRLEAQDHAILNRSEKVWRMYQDCFDSDVLTNAGLRRRVEAWDFIRRVVGSGFAKTTASMVRKRNGHVHHVLRQSRGTYSFDDLFRALARGGQAIPAVFEFGPAILSPESETPDVIRASWRKLCEATVHDRQATANDSFIRSLMEIRAGVVAPHEKHRVFLTAPKLEPPGVKLFKGLPRKTRRMLDEESSQWPHRSRAIWQSWSESHKGLLERLRCWIVRRWKKTPAGER